MTEQQTIQCPTCIKAISRAEWPAHVAWHAYPNAGFDFDRARASMRQDLHDFGLSPAAVRAALKEWDAEHRAPVPQQWHAHPALGYSQHMHPGGEDPAHTHPLTVSEAFDRFRGR